MRLTLIGIGGGAFGGVTADAADALRTADVLIGAERLLQSEAAVHYCRADAERVFAVDAEKLLDAIAARGEKEIAVLFSGDTGFYSGASRLIGRLAERGIAYRVLPGISSVQLLAAALGEPWQDWRLVSAHGRSCDPAAALMGGRDVLFLTGGEGAAEVLLAQLAEAGLGAREAVVGENLGGDAQRLVRGTVDALTKQRYAPLAVLLVRGAAEGREAVGGFGARDERFLRGDAPMTKQELRWCICGALDVSPGETVWDVGAGTGSVSIALARLAGTGRVFAVEREDDARVLIEKNREHFGAWNLTVVPGEAPGALRMLPAPDAVFVGGSGGRLAEILDAVLEKNPRARICISAILLETAAEALRFFAEREQRAEITQIAVSVGGEIADGESAGRHLMRARNPVFLITAGGRR